MPALLVFLALFALTSSAFPQELTPHTLSLPSGKLITLSLPAPFDINVAAAGLHRPRFFAESPDHRLFVTDLYHLSDNNRGAIYILAGWNVATHTFAGRTTYLDHLHNPNNVAFYTEPAQGGHPAQTWLYTALTDRLIRFRYNAGDTAPTGPPEVLAQFPAYGLNYKYGGWHLTRTVAFASLHGTTQLYVSVGSSCNACLEKEPIRASLTAMDPDGRHARILAHGLRNAVDLAFVSSIDQGALFASNMGDDHLGDRNPEDTFFELDSTFRPIAADANYGWPTCYFSQGRAHPDPLVSAPKPADHIFPPAPAGPAPPQFDCSRVPAAYTTFAAHSSPLGLTFFDQRNTQLRDTFLVALHGAGHPRIGTGYKVVRFSPSDRNPQPFIVGFLTKEASKLLVKGRPCGIFRTGPDSFLLTDDLNGSIYFVHPAELSGISKTAAVD